MNLLDNLKWRYATKRMNGKPVPTEKLDEILTAIQLAPTSMGVQPFKVLVISNKELKEKIHGSACQQPQILENSALLVFTVRDGLTDAEIDHYFENIAKTRSVTTESLSGFRTMVASLQGHSTENYFVWASRQAYIALGFGLVAAATLKIDATPMEGFNATEMDEVLGLTGSGRRSVVLMAIGYRDETTDYLVNLAKVRKPVEELFELI